MSSVHQNLGWVRCDDCSLFSDLPAQSHILRRRTYNSTTTTDFLQAGFWYRPFHSPLCYLEMATDNTGGAGSYAGNSIKWVHCGEAEDGAERPRISEDEYIDDARFITLNRRIENMASWVGQPSVKGSTEGMRMALLTLTAMGLQYVFVPSLRVLELTSPVQSYVGN